MEPRANVLKTDWRDGVLHLRLNRPKAHNALDEDLIEALHAAFAPGSKSPARVLVLSGEGKSFCAGADVAFMRRQGEASLEENERSALRLADLFARITTLAIPVVARVQGAAVGGGVGLVAACDIAVAAESASFTLAEVRLGLVPAVISPYLVRRIGLGRTRELVLTGRRIDAATALRLGLVDSVVPEAQLDRAVDDVVRDLKAGGPQALARAKRLLAEVEGALHEAPEKLRSLTARHIAEARLGEEGQAGLAAFLEKKPPPWAPGGSG